MKTTRKLKQPQVVYAGKVPKAVILDIAEYRKLLQRLDDLEDVREVEKRRKSGQHFRPFEDYLAAQPHK